MFAHLVARALPGGRPLSNADSAWRMWSYLKDGTPEAVAACLMPNHVHLVVESADVAEVWRSFAARLGAFARRAGYERLWAPLPAPESIPDVKHLTRVVRYVHLNPCRAAIVDDPLCWPWSTHRDAVGAALDPWVDPLRMASRLGRRAHGFAAWLHGYVSADPDVNVVGTPLPVAAPSCRLAGASLALVLDAASSATPLPRDARTRRHLAVLLAFDQGWDWARRLAEVLGMTADGVRRLARRRNDALLALGRLHLGDARLRAVPLEIRGRSAVALHAGA